VSLCTFRQNLCYHKDSPVKRLQLSLMVVSFHSAIVVGSCQCMAGWSRKSLGKACEGEGNSVAVDYYLLYCGVRRL
jgi:hypothetical protein